MNVRIQKLHTLICQGLIYRHLRTCILLCKTGDAKPDEQKSAGLLLETSAMLQVIYQQSGWKPLSIFLN